MSAKDFTKESGLEILIKKIKYLYIKKISMYLRLWHMTSLKLLKDLMISAS